MKDLIETAKECINEGKWIPLLEKMHDTKITLYDKSSKIVGFFYDTDQGDEYDAEDWDVNEDERFGFIFDGEDGEVQAGIPEKAVEQVKNSKTLKLNISLPRDMSEVTVKTSSIKNYKRLKAKGISVELVTKDELNPKKK